MIEQLEIIEDQLIYMLDEWIESREREIASMKIKRALILDLSRKKVA